MEKPYSKSAQTPEILINQSEIATLQPYIDEILETIGHSEALVDDESSLYDFGSFSDTIEHGLMKKIQSRFGIAVEITEPLTSIARKIRDSRKK